MPVKEICTPDKCTGCFACVNICPANCITMKEDKYGELHPVIDESICRNCNACVKSCPNNNVLDFRYPLHCYASWITDKSKRRICASGGLGTIMSEYVMKHEKGMVYGTQYDGNMEPHAVGGNTDEDLEKFKGSKYVQSIVGDAYSKIRNDLKSGTMVLYIGTPCQIAGLKTFLKRDYENLITVDLICHGVCPTTYLNQEIAYLKQKYGLKTLTDIRFRGNDKNDFCLSLWDRQKLLYRKNDYCDFYLGGFLWGVSLRENCYTCNYARPERISDITIGDFISLGKRKPFNHLEKNVSSVFVNTEKGEKFYNKVSLFMKELVNYERDYEERLDYAPSLKVPYKRDPQNKDFRENYAKYGFPLAIRKTLDSRVRKARRQHIWDRYFKRYYYNAPMKLMKILKMKFRRD